MMSFRDKLAKQSGPYKLLALDGGGIRGLISLEMLGRIERLLQETLAKGNQFVLADYFDYIVGTSTGAIIAAALSLGMRVEEIRQFYLLNGKQMFDRAFLHNQFWYKYNDVPLADLLKQTFHADTRLGSERLQTLLLLVLRNATTNSAWPLSNNPYAKYNQPDRLDNNLHIPLWQLVRASTAAPTFFPPELIRVGEQSFLFVDGGVTMYNNPAFQLFLMATSEPYRLQWAAGENNMLLISVGTGVNPSANRNLLPGQMNLLYNAASLPAALMDGALHEQDMLCRTFGRCLWGEAIDSEVGDLINQRGNFIQDMDNAMQSAERTIAILSPDYLNSFYTQTEWQSAYRQDPKGERKLLVLVRVQECQVCKYDN